MDAANRNRRLLDLSLELSEICHAVEHDLIRQRERRTTEQSDEKAAKQSSQEIKATHILEPPIL